jgi:uncharacterized protein (TIGR02246 family)
MTALVLGCLVFLGCGSLATDAPRLSPEDEASVRAVMVEYAEAWEANDKARVMATLVEDAILIPHHGHPVVAGRQAIEDFWWPGGPPSRVTAFTVTQEEVSGVGGLAYVRGTFELAFEYQGRRYASAGNYLALLRKGQAGAWRISHRIWNDPVPGEE